jgi:hypothetical protein
MGDGRNNQMQHNVKRNAEATRFLAREQTNQATGWLSGSQACELPTLIKDFSIIASHHCSP